MSKYILKKIYPGSEELYTTVKEVTGGYMSTNLVFYYKKQIEQYGEFWELVKEKEFEIVQQELNVKAAFLYNGFTIKSIRRLSDNEVFSIGDKVEHSYTYGNDTITKTCTIEKIYTLDDGSLRFYVGGGLNLGLEKLKKFIPKPLFITEDKVEVFHGDKLWLVNTNFEYYSFYSDCQNVGKRVFSTEKAAKNWINLNKPKYSMQDIFNAKSDESKFPNHFGIDFGKLKPFYI